jgi:ribosomal protein L30/L7E
VRRNVRTFMSRLRLKHVHQCELVIRSPTTRIKVRLSREKKEVASLST